MQAKEDINTLSEKSKKISTFVNTYSPPIILKKVDSISNFIDLAFADMRKLTAMDSNLKTDIRINPSLKPINISMKNFIAIIDRISPKVVCYMNYTVKPKHVPTASNDKRTRNPAQSRERNNSVGRQIDSEHHEERNIDTRPVYVPLEESARSEQIPNLSKRSQSASQSSYQRNDAKSLKLPKINQRNYSQLESVFGYCSEPFVLKYFMGDNYWQKINFDGKKSDFNGEIRHFGVTSLPNGRCVMTGGCFIQTNEASKLCFDGATSEPTRLTKIGSLKTARYGHGTCYLNGFVYVIGGFEHRDSDSPVFSTLKSCEKLNIKTFRWEKVTNLNQARAFSGVVGFNDQFVYAFGGYFNETLLGTIEKFDPLVGSWTSLYVSMNDKIAKMGVVEYFGNIVLLGGINSNFDMLREVWKFDPKKLVFSSMERMKHHRVGLQSCVVFDNYIYVFGGNNQMSCERFAVKERKWEMIDSYTTVLKGRSKENYHLEFVANF